MYTTTISTSLDSISSEIDSINRVIFETIGPYINGRALEMTSGKNSLCQFFIDHNRPVHLNETDESHFEILRANYRDNRLVRAVHNFNFWDTAFKETYPDIRDTFDTVIALNLPINHFVEVAENIRYVLPHGGTLALILPAYTSLYNGFDQDLGDWTRYNTKTFSEVLKFDFSIKRVRYLNLNPNTSGFYSASGLSVLAIFQKN